MLIRTQAASSEDEEEEETAEEKVDHYDVWDELSDQDRERLGGYSRDYYSNRDTLRATNR